MGAPSRDIQKRDMTVYSRKAFQEASPGPTSKAGSTMDIGFVTICGYMTHICCDTTARQAMELGFEVELLSDATGTLAISNNAGSVTTEELHRAILVTQEARFSRVLTTADWIELVRRRP